ncbi:MAG: hypothetical protein IJ797_02820 [Selenomonadaceae bacterium]|nr:hypothetical protein [Selenomonadaceae bacterium]
MKSVSKTLLAAVIAGSVAFIGVNDIQTAQAANAAANQTEATAENQQQPPRINIDKIAKEIAEIYGVKESEVRDALNAKKPLDDIYYAAMLAKVSGKSFKKVLSMKADWWDVQDALGITEEQIHTVMEDMMISDISVRSNVPEETVRKLLKEHYHPRDIRIAGRLANAAHKDIQSVLDMKKINQRWRDVANELGVSESLVRPRGPIEEQEEASEENNTAEQSQ